MGKMTVDELKKISQRAIEARTLGDRSGLTAEIIVHMGTCGIAAGGEKVLTALKEEIEKSGRKDLKIIISGCAGMCSSEPNVTIRRMGEEAIIYRDLTEETIRTIYKRHILCGEVQQEYALGRIRERH